MLNEYVTRALLEVLEAARVPSSFGKQLVGQGQQFLEEHRAAGCPTLVAVEPEPEPEDDPDQEPEPDNRATFERPGADNAEPEPDPE